MQFWKHDYYLIALAFLDVYNLLTTDWLCFLISILEHQLHKSFTQYYSSFCSNSNIKSRHFVKYDALCWTKSISMWIMHEWLSSTHELLIYIFNFSNVMNRHIGFHGFEQLCNCPLLMSNLRRSLINYLVSFFVILLSSFTSIVPLIEYVK